MDIQTTHEKSLHKYTVAITVFIIVVSLSLAIFTVSLLSSVEHAVEDDLFEAMARQSAHIDYAFSIRFQHLQAAADFLGQQQDVHGDIARQYIASLRENSSLHHVAVYDAAGNAVFDNGETYEGVDFGYVQFALQGQRSVSDQARSPVDGVMRFYLSVPIHREGEIIGALCASFDAAELDGLLFTDSYDGRSLLFLINQDGVVVHPALPHGVPGVMLAKDLYSQLGRARFPDGASAGALTERLMRRESGMAKYTPDGGKPLFLLYSPVADSGLMLMHAIPEDVAHENYSFIEVSVIVVGMVLLVCVLALVVFLVLSSTKSQRDLVQIAQTDPLTGLSNKQHTQESIDQWLASEARTGIQAMLFMDVDLFKQINDSCGHSVGDDALRFVGQALHQEFRSSDIIGRMGGDEFVVFMRNVPVKHVVRLHTESLRARMKSADIPGLPAGSLHLSVGIAYAPEHGDTYHDLYVCADKALYKTKQRGRDGYTEYAGEDA